MINFKSGGSYSCNNNLFSVSWINDLKILLKYIYYVRIFILGYKYSEWEEEDMRQNRSLLQITKFRVLLLLFFFLDLLSLYIYGYIRIYIGYIILIFYLLIGLKTNCCKPILQYLSNSSYFWYLLIFFFTIRINPKFWENRQNEIVQNLL